MAIRTYTVGDNSGVKRLDELTAPWIDVSLNLVGMPPIILYDVMTDPLDANKVFVCGQRDVASGNPGIFWSANGGVNWNACLGDVATSIVNGGNAILEIWVVDSMTIYATSHYGYCFKSVDGGITFNHTASNPFVPGFPAPQDETFSRAIHFPTDINGCLTADTGGQIHVQVTANGGNTWTPTDISTPYPNTGLVGGIHMSTDFQTITLLCEYAILRSTDGGTTFNSVYSVAPIDIGKGVRLLHLSWTSDADLWAYGSNSIRLMSTDNGATWPVINPWTGNLLCRAGHHYDTAPPHDGFFSENNDIFSTSDSSQTGTLSEANQFGGGIQAVWTGIADVVAPIPGCTDPTATNFNPIATADCAGVVSGTDYSCCEYTPDPGDPCECPPGYTYDPIANDCTLIETTPANCLPDVILIDRGNQNPQYSQSGANFYPDVTTLPWPLSDIVTGININNLQDNTLTPLLALQTVDNPLWGGPLNPNKGRLFDAGVWTNIPPSANNELPVNEWIGFTACVTVPVAGTYSIGFGGDNRVRLTLDGAPFAEVGANGGSYAFWYWSVVEVTLTAGQHIITIEGYNLSGPASFAAEIYSANVTTLIPMTTSAQLAAVTEWSTGDFIPDISTGEVPNIPFDLGEETGCSCPDGWVLSNCNGELECIQTTVVPATPCNCYLATNCEDPGDTELITIDPALPPLDLDATYVFTEFPGKCWTIELSTDCGANPGETILLNTGFIDANDTLGVQDNPDFNWNLVEDGTGPIAPQPAIIGNQLWWGDQAGETPPYGTLPQTPPVFPATFPSGALPPQALWITQVPFGQTHPFGTTTVYELQFTLPLGFVPNLNFDILTDNRAVIELNGNQIGDNSNPTTFPYNWNVAYNFGTSNPTHFVPGVQTLRVTITDNPATGSNTNSQGFAIMGLVESLVLPANSTEVTVFEIFTDCDDCLGTCYELTDCEGLLDPIITNSQLSGDLTQYVGQVVTIVTCPETCWQLEEIDCPLNVVESIDIINSFPDCATCLPKDPPPPPLVIRNRTVKPGYDTVGCSPEYVEKISCQYSETLFQEAASRRYGIEFCCNKDLQPLIIKKQLLDLKMITDPNACKPDLCCPPCSTTAIITVFDPIICPAPTGIDATLNIPIPTLQPNCVTVDLFIKDLTGDDPTTPYTVTGIDCCGIPFDITLYQPTQGVIPQVITLCVDLNQPYTKDPVITAVPSGNCDCDSEPPFDCFCVTFATNDGSSGFVAGNYCDGTPFDLSILPGVSYEPICVRADGAWSTSLNIVPSVLGDCTDAGTCVSEPICQEVTFTNNSSDVTEPVNFILCIDLPRNIMVGPGQTSAAVCIITGSAAFNPANVTMNIIGSCT